MSCKQNTIVVDYGTDRLYQIKLYRRDNCTAVQEPLPYADITKVELKTEDWCLSSEDNDFDLLDVDGAAVIEIVLGRIEDLQPGLSRMYITVYDLEATNGIGWDSIILSVNEWERCTPVPEED